MATLICNASGNLTGAATFARTELGAGATNLIRQSHTGSIVAAGTQTSVAFTVTNLSVIDGVLLWVRQGGVGSTGTFKVELQRGGATMASCTVNKTDLADFSGVVNTPTFFKFPSNATGDGGSNWTLLLTTTGTQPVNYCTHVSGVTNITRALRTTVAGTPAAGDDLYITGELTGAGTHNAFTVTMDSTVATVYGNGTLNSTTVSGGLIAISNWGTLSYGTAAATNYILRVAGDIRINQYGTLNIGSAGAEIPRNSTAVLEFQPLATDGDFGLICYDNSNVNIAGLSRTSGKNVVKCKLTSDIGPCNTVITSTLTATATTVLYTGPEAVVSSQLAGSTNETTANSTHAVSVSSPSVTNVTQTASVWLRQGAGPANNRYVRVTLGNNAVFTSVTNGFWVDVDLQAGTVSAITNIGTGFGTSATITAQGLGWLIEMTGKIATTAAAPIFLLNSCSALGTVTYVGVATNINFYFDHMLLVNAASQPDTTFNVDTDTGWLAGDAIAISGTNKTALEANVFALNANAGASSFTSALSTAAIQLAFTAMNFTYSGTAPYQAHIALLTRNVKIRSTSHSLTAFFYCTSLANINASWAEFSRLGASTGKRGIEFEIGATTANPKVFSYCSLYNFDLNGFYITATAAVSANATITNCTFWYVGSPLQIVGPIANNDWTFSNNLAIRPFTLGVSLGDVGGVCTNNIMCSGSSTSGESYALDEANGVIGTFANNAAYSNTDVGIQLGGAGLSGVIDSCTLIRNSDFGVYYIVDGIFDVTFTNLIAFGNTTYNFAVSDSVARVIGATISGDSVFPTVNGFSFTANTSGTHLLSNVDMSGVGTGQAPHTGVDFFFTTPADAKIQVENCKFGATVPFAKTLWTPSAYIGIQKYNQTAGDHRCEMKYGQVRTDQALYHALAPSMRMSPNSAANKLESAPKPYGIKVPVTAGTAVDVSVWVRKSDTLDNLSYNGGQPRLIQRANTSLGQNYDVVLATDVSVPASATGPAVWDSDTALLATLSNGSLTATNTGGSTTSQGVKTHTSVGKTSGKYYFEVKQVVETVTGNMNSVGIGLTTATIANMAGDTAVNGVNVSFATGNIYLNGAGASTLATPPANVLVGIATDLDLRVAWFRFNNGDWNNNSITFQNPATGVGGTNFAVLGGGAMMPFSGMGGSGGSPGNVYTANFGATAYGGTVPAGYSMWTGPTFSSDWVQLVGTSSVATDDGVWEFVVDCDGTNGWISVDDWIISGAATTANGMKNWYQGVPVIGGGGGGGGYFSGGFV